MTRIESLRALAPGLSSVPDDTVQMMLDMAADMLSRRQFGRNFDRACLLLAAHYLTLWNRIGQEEGGAGSAALVSGAVVMEKEGDLQRQYGSAGAEAFSASEIVLKKTLYGQMFLALQKRCVIPVVMRQGR